MNWDALISFVAVFVVAAFWIHAAYQRDLLLDMLAAERKRSEEKSVLIQNLQDVLRSLQKFAEDGSDEARAGFQEAVDRAVRVAGNA